MPAPDVLCQELSECGDAAVPDHPPLEGRGFPAISPPKLAFNSSLWGVSTLYPGNDVVLFETLA